MELHVWADDRRAASGEDGLDIGDIAAIAIALAKVERGVGREARSREGDADIHADGFILRGAGVDFLGGCEADRAGGREGEIAGRGDAAKNRRKLRKLTLNLCFCESGNHRYL